MEPPDPCPACLAAGAYAAAARGERQPARLSAGAVIPFPERAHAPSASTETAPPLASPAVTELPQLQEHGARVRTLADLREDRKSTRLNSSHGYISYAVFCLKKKKKQQKHNTLCQSQSYYNIIIPW